MMEMPDARGGLVAMFPVGGGAGGSHPSSNSYGAGVYGASRIGPPAAGVPGALVALSSLPFRDKLLVRETVHAE